MSKYWDRMEKAKRTAAEGIKTAFHMAKLCGHNHAQLLNARQAVLEKLPPRCPFWVSSYLQGISDMLYSEVYRNELEFIYQDAEGTWFSTAKVSEHRSVNEFYGNGRASELGNMKSFHAWKVAKKPFSTDRSSANSRHVKEEA